MNILRSRAHTSEDALNVSGHKQTSVHLNFIKEVMILTPEEMQKAILELQEMQKTTKAENETLKLQVAEKTKREKELEEHNQKLFLKITTETKEPEKVVEKEVIDFVGEKIYKLLSKKEIDDAKIIMNGEDE